MSEYTITELAKLTGTNRRNIHFYVQQGLLPPPDGAGLAARYRDEHALRLRAIPLLRSQGLRLDEIREKLKGLDRPALESLLAQPQAQPAAPSAPLLGPPGPPSQSVIRYRLAPGVELLVDTSAAHGIGSKIDDIIRTAQRVLGNPKSIGGHS